MVKFITKATLFLALGLGAISCKTYTYEHTHRIIEANKKNKFEATLNVDVTIIPDFTKRVKAQTTKAHRNVEDAKDEAYFNAITENQIDVLVAPIYSVEKASDGRCTATVHGYVGMYKMTLKTPKNDRDDQGNNDQDNKSNQSGSTTASKKADNAEEKNECGDKCFDQKLKDLEKLSKIDGILSSNEKKVYKINQTCGDCKNNEPLSLLTVTNNKSSLVDTYEKVLKVGSSSNSLSSNLAGNLPLPSLKVKLPKFSKK